MMELFEKRELKLKGWDIENNLMLKLNSVNCIKGVLHKENFLLLQFTGLYDKSKNEIYEGDIILIASKKFLVFWDPARSGWSFAENPGLKNKKPLLPKDVTHSTRLCSYLESPQSFQT